MRMLRQTPHRWLRAPGLTDRSALSLQFCAELNQPVLPNIRRWTGLRGCWKAVVADTPSMQLQKVPSSPRGPFLRI